MAKRCVEIQERAAYQVSRYQAESLQYARSAKSQTKGMQRMARKIKSLTAKIRAMELKYER